MTPTHPITIRLAVMMRRRLTTHWSDKELKQYKKLYKAHCFDDLEDLALLERWYAFERKRGELGRQRRDLITLLNKFQGEVDKARLWAEQHPLKPVPRKIIPLPPTPSEPLVLSAEDEERMEQFRAMMHAKNPQSKAWQPRSAFQGG